MNNVDVTKLSNEELIKLLNTLEEMNNYLDEKEEGLKNE